MKKEEEEEEEEEGNLIKKGFICAMTFFFWRSLESLQKIVVSGALTFFLGFGEHMKTSRNWLFPVR